MHDDELTLDQACAVSRERVWETLVRPVIWWGDDVVLEAVPGGAFHESWRDAAGQHHTRGEVKEIEPPGLLKLSWKDDDWPFETEVVFRILDAGEGSRIVLSHRGWETAPEADRTRLVKAHRSGWTYHLGNLSARAEARVPQ